MMAHVFAWIVQHEMSAAALLATKIEGVLWSAADILAVFGFLKILSVTRQRIGRKRIVIRYVLLWGTIILTPFLLGTKTVIAFYLLEYPIFGTHLAIAIYSFLVDGKSVIALLSDLTKSR